jgi:hypothetical protein
MSRALFGWTVQLRGDGQWVYYKRDCPEDLSHMPVWKTRKDARAVVAFLKTLSIERGKQLLCQLVFSSM